MEHIKRLEKLGTLEVKGKTGYTVYLGEERVISGEPQIILGVSIVGQKTHLKK